MRNAPIPARFEWERTTRTNEWVNMVRSIPRDSPLWAHGPGCPPACFDSKGRQRLRPGTLKGLAFTVATYAQPDGTNVHPGIRELADATGRARSTAAAGLAHLEACGLLIVRARGGVAGSPRWYATTYHLAVPPPGVLIGVLPAETEQRIHEWFQRPGAGDGAGTATA